MPISGKAKKESLELILLSVLAEQPLYGYAIIKQVAAKSDGSIRLTPGVLYPLLHQFENQKLITSNWEAVKSERNADDESNEGRKRKWYRLSAKGRKRLEQSIHAHRAYQEIIESFLPQSASRVEKGGRS